MALKAKLPKTASDRLAPIIDDVQKEERHRLNVDVPASHYKALKIKATEQGATISELVNKWVAGYISE